MKLIENGVEVTNNNPPKEEPRFPHSGMTAAQAVDFLTNPPAETWEQCTCGTCALHPETGPYASGWKDGRDYAVKLAAKEVMGQIYLFNLPGYQKRINRKLRMIGRSIRRIKTTTMQKEAE